jgi:hypothetical protein
MKKTTTIEQLLAEWGARHRSMPAQSTILKTEIMNRLPVGEGSVAEHRTRSGLPWFSIALTGLAVLAFVVLTPRTREIATQGISMNQSTSTSLFAPQMDSDFGGQAFGRSATKSEESIAPYPPSGNNQIPSTDDREFLKTDYSASARSRHPGELSERLQTIVRGYGGRIDSASSAEKSGYVQFVLPADKLEAFRQEARLVVGGRFLDEHLQTENLLSQKIGIESLAENVEKVLVDLHANKDQLIARHEQTVKDLQAQIAANTKERQRLVAQSNQYPDQAPSLQSRIAQLDRERASLHSRLANENTSYENQLAYADTQIKNAEQERDALAKQDTQLLNNVATVRGTISISWMSVWGWIDEYVPLRWSVPALLILAAIVVYAYHRRKIIVI